MPEPTNLYRFNSYKQKINEEVELEKYIDTESGTYLLTALDIDGNFKLELPTGQGKHEIIYDTFNEFQDREALYKRLDKGVFEFLQESMLEFQTLNVKEKPVGTDIIVTMNNDRYVLTVVQSTGFCKMKYPERVTEFYIDNIFLENPELPLIKDGRLIDYLKNQIKKKGLAVDLPQVPYVPMLKLEPKD
ncbi:MAG: hypothetical protein HYU68_00510 [Bacteroidetes bacterium]|nr:hypothetical protein [Bacteroidota bacterium]